MKLVQGVRRRWRRLHVARAAADCRPATGAAAAAAAATATARQPSQIRLTVHYSGGGSAHVSPGRLSCSLARADWRDRIRVFAGSRDAQILWKSSPFAPTQKRCMLGAATNVIAARSLPTWVIHDNFALATQVPHSPTQTRYLHFKNDFPTC